jgi:hypothetical protein
MSQIEAAIAAVFQGMPPGTRDEQILRSVISDLLRLGAHGLNEKLLEFKNARRAGRFASLMTELEFARFAGEHLKATPSFHTDDAADVSFLLDRTLCLADVVHKSAPLSYMRVFHPLPEDLALYVNTIPWQEASLRLHSLLQTLPVAVQPLLGKQFLDQRVTGHDRAQQEQECGLLASWLADELPRAASNREPVLQFSDGVTTCELEYLEASPGFMMGYAGVEPWFVVDGTLRQSIEEKAKKARERLNVNGAGCYLAVLGLDDAITSLEGRDLLLTLLGPLTHEQLRDGNELIESTLYRPVPASGQVMVEEALRQGRGDLIDAARFDRAKPFPTGALPAYFDPALQYLTAVLALCSTGEVHFVPNPFTTTTIDPLLHHLPADLKPFRPADWEPKGF